jgi:hypothetical protein
VDAMFEEIHLLTSGRKAPSLGCELLLGFARYSLRIRPSKADSPDNSLTLLLFLEDLGLLTILGFGR